MARYTGSVCKHCRREGQKLFLKGQKCYTEKCPVERRAYPPGQHGPAQARRRKQSDYATQLREKQKVKRIYGLLERQFRRTFAEAERMKGNTGENLLVLLERRLDNVVYHLGFGTSRSHSRQLIRHGHWQINGRRVDIPSYQVKPEDIISIKSGTSAETTVRLATELISTVPPWLQADHDALTAKVLRLPERDEIDSPVEEQLIVELYSK